MKKSIFALAALGAFAGAASAQSNITIYGLADVGIERLKTDPGETVYGLTSGNQSGSRIGFRGTEDLGGGLSATFALESGYDISTGQSLQGGRLFGRQAWVGLNSGFGSLKFGRQYTPMHIAHDAVDPFGTGLTGGGNGINALFDPYGVRMDNTVNYSINAAGFTGTLAYGFGENTAFPVGRQWAAGLGYANGPLNVQFAYHDQNPATGTVPAQVDAGNRRTAFLGGVYDLRFLKVHAAYGDNRDENAAGVTTVKTRDYMLGVTVPVGSVGALLAAYETKQDRIGSNDADYWQIGYTHDLSKRTNLYTSYSIVKNDGAGTTGGAPAGGDISWLNVGIRHKF